MRLIHDRAADGLGMKELLRRISVSRQWLDVQFKSLVGHTPSQEIRKVRLERVRHLLVYTDLSVQEISTVCGFSCVQNLVRAFRNAYGSPSSVHRSRHGSAV